MASAAPNQAPQNSSASSSRREERDQQRRPSLSQSTSSIDSQTVLLNDPSSSSAHDDRVKTPTLPQPSSSDEEPRKCWICFSDETEDTPTTSRWRSPCPCALTAHESCLLDWVADLEAPGSRQTRGSKTSIQCPQCKSDIIIARPKNYVVEVVKTVDRLASRLVMPGVVMGLTGGIYTGASMHGITSVYLIFGGKDFRAMIPNPSEASAKWLAAFPMIPIVLILSRTTLADGVLPALPILFFASQMPTTHSQQPTLSSLWPPSAAMTVAMLPYVRGVYNELYRIFFAEREARWLKEVQPRAGEMDDDEDDEPDAPEERRGGVVGVDWDIEVEIAEDVFDDDPGHAQQQHEHEHQDQEQAQQQGQPGHQQGARQAQGRDRHAEQQGPERQGQNGAHALVVTGSRIADVVMGALCFPAIASLMGELLKLGLPRSWTQPLPSSARKPGLLHTKWGRSIVGGCLFVVMKDTLLLYSKYRMARDHRMRRVMNYDKRKGKIVD